MCALYQDDRLSVRSFVWPLGCYNTATYTGWICPPHELISTPHKLTTYSIDLLLIISSQTCAAPAGGKLNVHSRLNCHYSSTCEEMCSHPQMACYHHKLEFRGGTVGCQTCFTIQVLHVKAHSANVESLSPPCLWQDVTCINSATQENGTFLYTHLYTQSCKA